MSALRPVIQPVIASSSGEPRRRLLLVSYHFPPDPAVGGLRWQQLTKYFVERGWTVDVIARDLAKVAARDDARARGLPPEVRVVSAPESDPWLGRSEQAALAFVRRFARPSATMPSSAPRGGSGPVHRRRKPLVDAHAALVTIARQKAWSDAAASLGTTLANQASYDVVVSSGPPHMAHDAARLIANAAGVPLVIDLRDPWSAFERTPGDTASPLASPLWFAAARYYERRAVRAAALIVMNTDSSRDEMRRRYPSSANRIITVANGSDGGPLPVVSRSERFTIRFAGTIYLDRDPRLVFRAAATVVRRHALTAQHFAIEFIGEADEFKGQSVRAIAEEEGIADFVSISGLQPRDAAMRFLAGASMLLSLPQHADLCVPAKIFEYVRFDAWLLILATERSSTAQLLRGTGADVVDPSDVDRIATVIERRYLQHARGERPVAVGHAGQFDRARQAEILLQSVEAIVTSRR
jgi:hypothetical protein